MRCAAGEVCGRLRGGTRLNPTACEGAISIRVAIACELIPTGETGYAPAGARSREGFRPAGNLYRLIPRKQSDIVAR